MECFSHSGVQAVGICKTCGKAVCRTCAVDVGIALACSDACADEAKDVHEMNQKGKKIYGIGASRSKLPSGVIMWLLFAAFFGGYGIYVSYRKQQPEWFLLIFGAISLVIAVIAYRRAKDLGLQC